MSFSVRSANLVIFACFISSFLFQANIVLPTWPQLFGDRTTSMFDIWCIGHLMFGVIVTGTLERMKAPRTEPRMVFVATLGLLINWEMFELCLEYGTFGEGVQFWKHGYEHWSNRYIADPLIGSLGYAAYRRWPAIFYPTLFVGAIWEIIQLNQPTSMTIQNWLIARF